MGFASKLYNLITGITGLSAAVEGIFYQNMPDNSPIDKINVVYDFNLIDSIDHLKKNNELDIYHIELIIVAPGTDDIESVVSIIRAYLDNYVASDFRDFHPESIDTSFEGERGQYVGRIKYKLIYQS
jgi:hypothetical protein